ncbi:uncharacterized protein LOC114333970 [Diabrotica virgifera virgifera]|uniref:Uncharacterized protein LOC114333970 n=1 Tax=Diabrotica virgifera virgifera TaxID=50390 RepID=A0A6P7G5H9_DIAVI|nr:uncharacterized protein LOC114333970 [Diabrotica virgifera virgifera]
MEKITKSFDDIINAMEKDNRGAQITCYSVALLGLTVALRKVRPLSRFRKPSDIPNHFIKEKRELTGQVKRIDPNGGLLIIEHKPLVPLPIIPSGDLPVKISGVNVTGLGTTWLQSVVADKEVTFIPVSKDKDFVQCQVLLSQTTKDEKQQIINIGESLVKIGFALPEHIEKPLSEDPFFLRYYGLLLKAEKVALRKKLGLKYYIIPTKKVAKQLNELFLSLFVRTKESVPKLIYKIPKTYQS